MESTLSPVVVVKFLKVIVVMPCLVDILCESCLENSFVESNDEERVGIYKQLEIVKC